MKLAFSVVLLLFVGLVFGCSVPGTIEPDRFDGDDDGGETTPPDVIVNVVVADEIVTFWDELTGGSSNPLPGVNTTGMQQRLGTIQTLMDQEKVGEAADGKLAVVQANFATQMVNHQGLVQSIAQFLSAENADRNSVYSSMAAEHSVVAGEVASASGKVLADRAKVGHWVRKPDGTWHKKTASLP